METGSNIDSKALFRTKVAFQKLVLYIYRLFRASFLYP
jgi:hypothetical protein